MVDPGNASATGSTRVVLAWMALGGLARKLWVAVRCRDKRWYCDADGKAKMTLGSRLAAGKMLWVAAPQFGTWVRQGTQGPPTQAVPQGVPRPFRLRASGRNKFHPSICSASSP
jgi:hypothetical protein